MGVHIHIPYDVVARDAFVEMARLVRMPRDHMMQLFADLQGFDGGYTYSHTSHVYYHI